MKKFYLKHRILTVCFFFTIFVFLIIEYIGIPLIGKIVAQRDSLQENLLDLEIVKKRKEKIPQMEENKKEIDSQKEVLEVILDGNEVNFIEHLEKIAQETGNEIKLEIDDSLDSKKIVKKTREEKKEGGTGILEKINYDNYFFIKFNITGNYENLVDFIHILENDQFYVNIFSIDIQKGEMEKTVVSGENSKISVGSGVLRGSPFLNFPSGENENNSQTIIENAPVISEEKEILKSLIEVIVYKKK